MNWQGPTRIDGDTRAWVGPNPVWPVLFAAMIFAATALNCGSAAPPGFPSGPSGRLEISYPHNETLFPPEIVAPTFLWQDATEGVAR